VKAESASHVVIVDSRRLFDRRPFEHFDRLAFALRTLSILRPSGMRVALYSRLGDFLVESGRELGSDNGDSWALVGIPRDASRQSIALALSELAGCADAPFLVDLLASTETSPGS
jgi:hypothetical protein